MKKITTPVFLGMSIVLSLTGCGGGGGGGTAPTPAPPPSFTFDPCAQFRNDGRNADKYLTEEYCKMQELGKLGVSTAYSNGYTGQGVKVAVVDSGADMQHYDLKNNIVQSEAISYTAVEWDTTNDVLVNTTGGVTYDQIEGIHLSSGGSGYSTAPTVTVSGDGTGAQAVAILDANGSVSGVYMTDRGSGYTNATITIDDSGTGGSGATISDFYFGGTDENGHGSGVSGIIAGEKNQVDVNATYDGSFQGVAYNADIVPVKVLWANGNGEAWMIESGVKYAKDINASIINLSIGTTDKTAFSKTEFLNAVQAGSSIVVAAGNDGLDCLPDSNGDLNGRCSFPAALPYLSGNSDLLNGDGGWIVVGSVDANENLSTFSNKAGVMKDNYLVAYGESIISADKDGGEAYHTGTSFATPFVSGAMALMIEKYPHLKGKDVAQIFFDTAKDLGAAGVDDVYGHGLIDVYAAFAPIGALGITAQGTTSKVSNDKKVSIQSTKLSLSGIAGASLVKSQALENTVAFDDWGRDFNVDMTQAVSIDTSKQFNFDNFMQFNYGRVILGLDTLRQNIMVGYKISKNSKFMLSADDTLLGGQGEGALSFDKANTIYSAIKGNIETSNADVHFGYQMNYGFAWAKENENSLITHIDNIHALGGSIKAYYKNFGVGYEIPLTAVSGSMELSVPVSREIDGTVNYYHSTEKMSNKNFERRVSIFYQLSTKSLNSLISYELIKNYGGVESAKLEKRVLFNLSYLFN